jgi:hypothetical protein
MKQFIPALLLLTLSTATAQVVFNQSFNFTAGQNGAVLSEGDPGVIGWRGSYGASGTALPFSNEFDGFVGSYAWAISDGNFLYATNTDNASNPRAWMIHTTNLDVQYSDVITTGYGTLDFYADVPGQTLTGKTYGDITSLDIEMRNPDATDLPGRFALEVDLGGGPEWVVADTPFFGVDNSFSLYSLVTDPAAGWLQNVYTPDSFLANGPLVGTSILIPDTAPVTGYGIYFEVPDGFTSGGTGTDSSSIRVRLREFNITAVVPEPSTYALLLGAAALLLVARRRRS